MSDIALEKFVLSFRRSLSRAPKGETKAEQRVRLLTNVLIRCLLFDDAGLLLETPNGRDTACGHLQPLIERELFDARLAVRFERGDL